MRRWAAGRQSQPGQRHSAFPDGVPTPLPRSPWFRRKGADKPSGANAPAPSPTSAFPDGVPSLLPLAGGRGGKVLQRFSGSGVAERALTSTRERRARTTTIALSLLAVLLLIGSAIFLFNPFQQNPGFGFAVGMRYKTLHSSDTLKIADDPPKLPTPPSKTLPTPTPPGGQPTATPGAKPTATPQPRPTATPRPTPTPTPVPSPTATPLPIGSAATVTFTATTQNLQSQPATISDCASGCNINAYQHLQNNVTESGYYSATGPWVATQTLRGYLWVAYLSGVPDPTYALVTLTVGGLSCTVDINGLAKNNAATVLCDTKVYSPLTKSPFSGTVNGATCYNGQTANRYKCNFAFQLANSSQPLTTNPKGPTVTYNDCHNAMDYLAYTKGKNAMGNWLSSNTNSGWRLAAKLNDQNYPYIYGNWTCSPGIGSIASSGSFYASDTTWVDAWTFNPTAVQNYAMSSLNGQLPSGYVWKTSATGCALTSSVSGSTINVGCQYSRTAVYDWNQSVKDSLAQKLAHSNLDAAAATNICNNTPGVVPGSCTVTITNGTLMPNNYQAISFTIN